MNMLLVLVVVVCFATMTKTTRRLDPVESCAIACSRDGAARTSNVIVTSGESSERMIVDLLEWA